MPDFDIIILMKEIKLKEKLCLNFCPYYKPVKTNELACMGFLILERLLKKGKKIPFDKSAKILNGITEATLVQNMCVFCPFHESDCDFIQKKEKALPCGGFIFLGHLLETNIISIDDINNIE